MSYPYDMEKKDLGRLRCSEGGGGAFSVCFGSCMFHHFNGLSPCHPGFVCDPTQMFRSIGVRYYRLERPPAIFTDSAKEPQGAFALFPFYHVFIHEYRNES